MSRTTRREFLKTVAAASAAFPLFTISGTQASGKVLGANDAIRVGVVGVGGRGGGHVAELLGVKGVQITYLVDADSSRAGGQAKTVELKGGNKPKCVQDVRQALEDKNLDAISIATTNHWHSLATVWACQAGKDVYVEKPLSHNIFEGRKCVEAARKYQRVVQHGTQQRSSESRAKEVAAVQSGKYGKLLVSKGYCCKPRWSIGTKPVSDPPANLDFNLWLGPAPQQPFHANLHPYNWHWFWDFGNGDTGNQGVHEIDIARWAIKGSTLPTKVWSLGGRFLPDAPDQGQTPNTQMTVFEYGETILLFETRGLVGKEGVPAKVANEYYTTEGVIKDSKFYPKNGGPAEPVSGGDPVRLTPGGHFGAFIAAVRSRKPEDNNADVEIGHYSAALCHLANIAYRLGKPVPFSQKPKTLGDNKRVVEAFDAIRENLNAVKVKLDNATYQLSPVLTFDPAAEKFVGNDEANALLTRDYRTPFVVPEKV